MVTMTITMIIVGHIKNIPSMGNAENLTAVVLAVYEKRISLPPTTKLHGEKKNGSRVP